MKGAATIGVAVVCWGVTTSVGEVAAQRAARVRPPLALKCPRESNHLTAYTGVVINYVRGADRTTLRIRTDWATTEDVAIEHKGGDPARWFLYRGNAFTPTDWDKITSAKGQLRPNLRATAWVCDDGSNPIVEWDVPEE